MIHNTIRNPVYCYILGAAETAAAEVAVAKKAVGQLRPTAEKVENVPKEAAAKEAVAEATVVCGRGDGGVRQRRRWCVM